MINLFKVAGRLVGRTLRSQAFDRGITIAAGYIISEMKLTDVKAKRTLLRRKRKNHLILLGRTVYRLILNDVDPLEDDHIHKIVRVLGEIDMEISMIEDELKLRRKKYEEEKSKKKQSMHEKKTDTA